MNTTMNDNHRNNQREEFYSEFSRSQETSRCCRRSHQHGNHREVYAFDNPSFCLSVNPINKKLTRSSSLTCTVPRAINRCNRYTDYSNRFTPTVRSVSRSSFIDIPVKSVPSRPRAESTVNIYLQSDDHAVNNNVQINNRTHKTQQQFKSLNNGLNEGFEHLTHRSLCKSLPSLNDSAINKQRLGYGLWPSNVTSITTRSIVRRIPSYLHSISESEIFERNDKFHRERYQGESQSRSNKNWTESSRQPDLTKVLKSRHYHTMSSEDESFDEQTHSLSSSKRAHHADWYQHNTRPMTASKELPKNTHNKRYDTYYTESAYDSSDNWSTERGGRLWQPSTFTGRHQSALGSGGEADKFSSNTRKFEEITEDFHTLLGSIDIIRERLINLSRILPSSNQLRKLSDELSRMQSQIRCDKILVDKLKSALTDRALICGAKINTNWNSLMEDVHYATNQWDALASDVDSRQRLVDSALRMARKCDVLLTVEEAWINGVLLEEQRIRSFLNEGSNREFTCLQSFKDILEEIDSHSSRIERINTLSQELSNCDNIYRSFTEQSIKSLVNRSSELSSRGCHLARPTRSSSYQPSYSRKTSSLDCTLPCVLLQSRIDALNRRYQEISSSMRSFIQNLEEIALMRHHRLSIPNNVEEVFADMQQILPASNAFKPVKPTESERLTVSTQDLINSTSGFVSKHSQMPSSFNEEHGLSEFDLTSIGRYKLFFDPVTRELTSLNRLMSSNRLVFMVSADSSECPKTIHDCFVLDSTGHNVIASFSDCCEPSLSELLDNPIAICSSKVHECSVSILEAIVLKHLSLSEGKLQAAVDNKNPNKQTYSIKQALMLNILQDRDVANIRKLLEKMEFLNEIRSRDNLLKDFMKHFTERDEQCSILNYLCDIPLSLENYSNLGLITTEGHLLNPINGNSISLLDAIQMHLIDDHLKQIRVSGGDSLKISIASAIQNDLLDTGICPSLRYDGNTFNLYQAIEEEIIVKPLSLGEAFVNGIVNKSGQIFDKISKRFLNIDKAERNDLLNMNCTSIIHPANKSLMSLKDAISSKLITVDGKFVNKLTNTVLSIYDAVKLNKLGLVILYPTMRGGVVYNNSSKRMVSISEAIGFSTQSQSFPGVQFKKRFYPTPIIDLAKDLYIDFESGKTINTRDAVELYGLVLPSFYEYVRKVLTNTRENSEWARQINNKSIEHCLKKGSLCLCGDFLQFDCNDINSKIIRKASTIAKSYNCTYTSPHLPIHGGVWPTATIRDAVRCSLITLTDALLIREMQGSITRDAYILAYLDSRGDKSTGTLGGTIDISDEQRSNVARAVVATGEPDDIQPSQICWTNTFADLDPLLSQVSPYHVSIEAQNANESDMGNISESVISPIDETKETRNVTAASRLNGKVSTGGFIFRIPDQQNDGFEPMAIVGMEKCRLDSGRQYSISPKATTNLASGVPVNEIIKQTKLSLLDKGKLPSSHLVRVNTVEQNSSDETVYSVNLPVGNIGFFEPDVAQQQQQHLNIVTGDIAFECEQMRTPKSHELFVNDQQAQPIYRSAAFSKFSDKAADMQNPSLKSHKTKFSSKQLPDKIDETTHFHVKKEHFNDSRVCSYAPSLYASTTTSDATDFLSREAVNNNYADDCSAVTAQLFNKAAVVTASGKSGDENNNNNNDAPLSSTRSSASTIVTCRRNANRQLILDCNAAAATTSSSPATDFAVAATAAAVCPSSSFPCSSSSFRCQQHMNFIDVVNTQLLNIDTGVFKHPCTPSRHISIREALNEKLINPCTAFVIDPVQYPVHAQNTTDTTNKQFTSITNTSTTNRRTNPENSQSTATASDHFLTDGSVNTNIINSPAIDSGQPSYKAVILERNNRSFNLQEAVNIGLITEDNRLVVDNRTGSTVSIAEAMKSGLMRLSDSSLSYYNIISKTESFSIKSVKNTAANIYIDPNKAIKLNILDLHQSAYFDLANDCRRYSIEEAIQMGFILVENISNRARSLPHSSSQLECRSQASTGEYNVCRSPSHNAPSSVNENLVSTSLIRETRSYNLVSVTDALSGEEMSVQRAIDLQILDHDDGRYYDRKRQIWIPIIQAINEHLIKVTRVPVSDRVDKNKRAVSETRTYALKEVKNTKTNEFVNIRKAIEEGIIDQRTGLYYDIARNVAMPISLAVERRLILTEENCWRNKHKTSNAGPTFLRRDIKYLSVEGIIDPETRQIRSLDDAISKGILDTYRCSFYIAKEKSFISLTDAYSRGYLVGKYISEDEMLTEKNTIIVRICREEKSYLINYVLDTKNQRHLSLNEAIRRGLFNADRAVYINPITSEESSLADAIMNGYVDARMLDGSKPTRSARNRATSTKVICVQKRPAIDRGSEQDMSDVYKVDTLEEYVETMNYGKSKGKKAQTADSMLIEGPSNLNEQTFSQRTMNTTISHSTYHTVRHKERNVKERDIVIEPQQDRRKRTDSMQSHGMTRSTVEELIIEEPGRDGERVINVDNVPCSTSAPIIIEDSRPSKSVSHVVVIDGDDLSVRRLQDATDFESSELVSDKESSGVVVPAESAGKLQTSTLRISTKPTGDRYPLTFAPHEQAIIDERIRTVDVEPIYSGSVESIDKDRKQIDSSTRVLLKSSKIGDVVDDSQTCSMKQQFIQEILDKAKSYKSVSGEVPVSADKSFFKSDRCTYVIKGLVHTLSWVLDPANEQKISLEEGIKRKIFTTHDMTYHDTKNNRNYEIEQAVRLGFIGTNEDCSPVVMNVDGITYTIHWVLDPIAKHKILPRKAVEKGVLDTNRLRYFNPQNNVSISVHEAVKMKFIGADETRPDSEEIMVTVGHHTVLFSWVLDTIVQKQISAYDALKRGLIDISSGVYFKQNTGDIMTLWDAFQCGFIGTGDFEHDVVPALSKSDSVTSLDEDELTISTKTATYVIIGVIHPITQQELSVSEAIELNILDKNTGSYHDASTGFVHELSDAINNGLMYATVIESKESTEMETSSTKHVIQRFIINKVIDPRDGKVIGGLQAQSEGILNYAQGIYCDPETLRGITIREAIDKTLIEVELINQTSDEQFELDLIRDSLLERRITTYSIFNVVDPIIEQNISAQEAVNRGILDTDTKTYFNAGTGKYYELSDALVRGFLQADVKERVVRKPLGLSLQNAARLGFYNYDTGKFKDPGTEQTLLLKEAIDKGHINMNGPAIACVNNSPLSLREAFNLRLISRTTGILDRDRLSNLKGKITNSRILRMNVEDAVRCGLLNLHTGHYKHIHTGEYLSLKGAIERGLLDGDSTIIEHPFTGRFMTIGEALNSLYIESNGNITDLRGQCPSSTLEKEFNSRRMFSAFNINTGEIFLPKQAEMMTFEKYVQRFGSSGDPCKVALYNFKTDREYNIIGAIEHGVMDLDTGKLFDFNNKELMSIREAIRRGYIAIIGSPIVPFKADHDTLAIRLTSRKRRLSSRTRSGGMCATHSGHSDSKCTEIRNVHNCVNLMDTHNNPAFFDQNQIRINRDEENASKKISITDLSQSLQPTLKDSLFDTIASNGNTYFDEERTSKLNTIDSLDISTQRFDAERPSNKDDRNGD